jgi:hypothetical protein
MPKVRVLSGSQAGQVVEMDAVVAQTNVDFGYAEYVDESKEADVEPEPEVPVRAARPKPKAKSEDDE